jgi:hypothetical protein
MWYRRQRFYRSKIAVEVSHLRLLEHVTASNRSTLILEDDAQLTGEKWLPDLLTALQELPEVCSNCSWVLGGLDWFNTCLMQFMACCFGP